MTFLRGTALDKIIILRPSSISTGAVQLTLEAGVDMVHLNPFGMPVGRIFSSSPKGMAELRKAQVVFSSSRKTRELFEDTRGRQGSYRLSNDGKRKIVEAAYNRLNEQVFWDGKRREMKAVSRHQMQCLAQYFRGQRSRYEPFRFDAVKKSLAEEGQLSLTLPSAC